MFFSYSCDKNMKFTRRKYNVSTSQPLRNRLAFIRHIECMADASQVASRAQKFERRLANGLFCSELSKLITIPDWPLTPLFILAFNLVNDILGLQFKVFKTTVFNDARHPYLSSLSSQLCQCGYSSLFLFKKSI